MCDCLMVDTLDCMVGEHTDSKPLFHTTFVDMIHRQTPLH